MKLINILFLSIFTISIQSLTFRALNTLSQTQLNPNDYVTSTLGLFRFSLQQKTCQLKIELFDSNLTQSNYFRLIGYYPKDNRKNCNSLKLNLIGLYTNQKISSSILEFRELKYINNTNLLKEIKQTLLTIDDNGVIRLQLIFNNQTIKEKWITSFKNPQKFIKTTNNDIISIQNSLSIIKNLGNWGFSATKLQFRIFHLNNISIITKYKYPSLIISSNLIKDINGFTFPLINLQGIKYQPRYGIPKQTNFRSPYVFVLNKFWPQLRILDQQGYEILNIRYPSINCLKDIGVEKIRNSYQCISWFCPPQTFQLNGECLVKCLYPYFSQIDKYNKNRCVLVCQAGTFINNETNVCSSYKTETFICPYNLSNTPFGCVCPNKTYFILLNGQKNMINRKLNELCVKKCPIKYIQYNQGFCISCPIFCLKCDYTNNSIALLKCVQCDQGFQVFNHYCRKICFKFFGNYVSKNKNQYECIKCSINFCKRCSFNNSIQICIECLLPYTLNNNSCQTFCPRNSSILTFNQNDSLQCLPLSKCSQVIKKVKIDYLSNKTDSLLLNQCKNCGKFYCLQSCEQNIFFHNSSSCFCIQNTTSFIQGCNYTLAKRLSPLINYSNFLEVQNNPCPIIDYYFNYKTNQCLKCPFGCLTCVLNQQGYPQCTSCPQNYMLLILDGNYCQKKSALVKPFYYNPKRKFGYYWQNLIENDSGHRQCLKQNQNCFFCLLKSNNYCTICNEGYYLYAGKCIVKCPQKFYGYQHQAVCLPFTIQNCHIQQILMCNYFLNINSNTQFIEGYRYFTSKFFTQIHNQNDPIGLIFIYYGLLKKKIESERTTLFEKGLPTCIVCNEGYGLTPLGKCQICKSNCLLCVNSNSNYCLRCHPYYYLNAQNQCVQYAENQKPCLGNQYRNQKGLCQNQCKKYYKIKQTKRKHNVNQKIVNCTNNCPDDMDIYKIQNDMLVCLQKNLSKIQNIQKMNLNLDLSMNKLKAIDSQPIKLMGSCYEISTISICMIIPTIQVETNNLINLNFTFYDQKLKNTSKRLLFEKNYNVATFENKSLIVIKGQNRGAIIAEFQLMSFSNNDKSKFLANSLYGFQINQQSSMLDSILNKDYGLHYYSRMLVVLFFLIAVLNFGKNLNYKIDNIFITMTTIYLTLTRLDLNLEQGSYLVYGWMYGFSWSTSLQLFSNARQVTKNQLFFTPNYLQKARNTAHYLLLVDDNLMRNCWSIFICFILSLSLISIFWILTKILTQQTPKRFYFWNKFQKGTKQQPSQISKCNQKTNIQQPQQSFLYFNYLYGKQDLDHFIKILNFSIFLMQNSMTGLFYYCLLQITSRQWQLASKTQLFSHKFVAWIFLFILILYSFLRLRNNLIGGIYMFKRYFIGLAIFICPSFQRSINIFLFLFFIQLSFTGIRLYFQCRKQFLQFILYLKKNINKIKQSQQKQKFVKIPQITQENKFILSTKQDLNRYQNQYQNHKRIIQNGEQIPQNYKFITDKTINFHEKQKKQFQMEKQTKKDIWNSISTTQLRNIFIEQSLIVLIYLMVCINYQAPNISIFVTYLTLLVFLIMFVDQLIVDLIDYSEINQKKISNQKASSFQFKNKLKNNLNPFYFKIRNSFDFQQQSRVETINLKVNSNQDKKRRKFSLF